MIKLKKGYTLVFRAPVAIPVFANGVSVFVYQSGKLHPGMWAWRGAKFIVTTNSNHGLHVYPNRAAGMVLTGIDQLWLADITYIRLLEEFVYLALILDAYSRKGIGWALGRTLEATLSFLGLGVGPNVPSWGSIISDGRAHTFDAAVQRRLCDDASVPDRFVELVARDHPLAIFDEVREQAKNLRLERLRNSVAAKFESLGIQLAISKSIDQANTGRLVVISGSA